MFSEYKNHVVIVTIFVVIIIACFCSLIIILGYLSQKKRLQQMVVIENMEKQHKANIMDVEVKTQRETFAKISGELSRTVGKKLRDVEVELVASLPLQNDGSIQMVKQATVKLSYAVEELRDMSRSMSSEIIKHYGLKSGIELELEQLKKYKVFKTSFQMHGEQVFLKGYEELMMFRIIQEGIKNCVRHSQGQSIEVVLDYNSERIEIKIKDNGVGYPSNLIVEVGKGLNDIERRLKLLKGKCELTNCDGALLTICIPVTEDNILLEEENTQT